MLPVPLFMESKGWIAEEIDSFGQTLRKDGKEHICNGKERPVRERSLVASLWPLNSSKVITLQPSIQNLPPPSSKQISAMLLSIHPENAAAAAALLLPPCCFRLAASAHPKAKLKGKEKKTAN
jgi:hypothetical protein